MGLINHGDAEKWARELYGNQVDRKDAKGFARAFTEDGTLRFGNNEALFGQAQIETAIAQFFLAMEALRHEFVTISCDENTLFLEAKVTYRRHDGGMVTVPAMTVFVMERANDELLARDCRIYVDLTPLFAPAT